MADNDVNKQAVRAADPAPARSADPARVPADRARDGRREAVDAESAARAERPQDVGGKPTPTQRENDEIRNGLRHIDDKEDDGSGPDPLVGRNLRADALRRGYETR